MYRFVNEKYTIQNETQNGKDIGGSPEVLHSP
jgi:hypothetical protein